MGDLVAHKAYESSLGRVGSTAIEAVPIEYTRPWATSLFMQLVFLPNYLFTAFTNFGECWNKTTGLFTDKTKSLKVRGREFLNAWWKPIAWCVALYAAHYFFWHKLTSV